MAQQLAPPTPYAIGVATLISYIEWRDADDGETLSEPKEFVEGLLLEHQHQLSSIMMQASSLSDLLHHPSLSDLSEFGGWLQTATHSFDAFIDLMSSLTVANAKSTADLFRRHLVLRYERLSMTEVVVLYKRFCRETKEAISNTKKPSARDIPTSIMEFDAVLECLQNKDRVGAVEQLHQTMDHSLYALSAAGDFQELIFSAFGENTTAARREGIRAAQKQGEHQTQSQNEDGGAGGNATSHGMNRSEPSGAGEQDPELAMLKSLLNGKTQSSLEDRHIVARKKLMGRFQQGQILYQEALKCMIGGGDTEVPFEFIGFFLHEWAVRRDDWIAADAWMAAIECHLHPRLDPNIFADYISQKALSLSRQGKWKPAVKLIEGYLERQQEEQSLDEMVWDRMCLQLGQILLDARQYTAAQATLLQRRVCASSLSLLAILHLEFYRDIEKARGFAAAACPTIMLQEHVFLQGQTMLTMARCTGSLPMYERSIECFYSIQDVAALRKAYQHMADEYQRRNEPEKCEKAVAKIKDLSQKPDTCSPLPDSDELLSFIDKFAASGRVRIGQQATI